MADITLCVTFEGPFNSSAFVDAPSCCDNPVPDMQHTSARTDIGCKTCKAIWFVIDITQDERRVSGQAGGLKGGRARAERLSPERRSEIARKAANARWGNR